jgi:hypothetical protein
MPKFVKKKEKKRTAWSRHKGKGQVLDSNPNSRFEDHFSDVVPLHVPCVVCPVKLTVRWGGLVSWQEHSIHFTTTHNDHAHLHPSLRSLSQNIISFLLRIKSTIPLMPPAWTLGGESPHNTITYRHTVQHSGRMVYKRSISKGSRISSTYLLLYRPCLTYWRCLWDS